MHISVFKIDIRINCQRDTFTNELLKERLSFDFKIKQ